MSIEANAKTDLAVAKMCGLEDARIEYSWCFYGHGVHQRSFQPTRDMNHAKEAAKAVGLFDKHVDEWGSWRYHMTRNDGGAWELTPRRDCSGKWVRVNRYLAPTPELAICEAILAMAEAKEES